MNYAIITENDVSQWSDSTGEIYHFPKRYLKILQPGTKVVYYKGRMKDRNYEKNRLTSEPHYFGIGEIATLQPDLKSTKEDYFGQINHFVRFAKAVPFKFENNYIETVPSFRETNYWRDGVRLIDENTYNKILLLAEIKEGRSVYNDENLESPALISEFYEGGQKKKYTTFYERDPKAREQAVTIHGYTCMACGLNFEEKYGEWGKGFIHVHHVKPVSTVSGKSKINPAIDLVVLCANCHSMVHRRRDKVLTLEELVAIIKR